MLLFSYVSNFKFYFTIRMFARVNSSFTQKGLNFKNSHYGLMFLKYGIILVKVRVEGQPMCFIKYINFSGKVLGEEVHALKPYAAHILRENEDDPNSKIISIQTIDNHVKGVAEKAAMYAGAFNAAELAMLCGLAHDIGKYSRGFQKRIWDNGPKVDHSTAGAVELMKQKGLASLICAYCVAGHHAGLMDRRVLDSRLNKNLERYEEYTHDISLSKASMWKGKTNNNSVGFSIYFLTKMLFSCLVDADYLDTEAFMRPSAVRSVYPENLSYLQDRLESHLQEKGFLCGKNGINFWRSEILKNCIKTGDGCDTGVYTLSVPTGGGKTVSSLAFALHHAVKRNKHRIIYVVPFCAIIDQTVDIFNTILGDENVLAHYSEADYEGSDEYEVKKLACENWDMPVIVTTAVQFYESLFSNKTSKCRKLHNIADSVVVFDEAQTLPREYLEPCVCSIAELSSNYNTTCVLCTATQPSLEKTFQKYYPEMQIKEICDDSKELYQLFKRVSYEYIGKLTDEELSAHLLRYDKVLCIVSTRAQAKNVYELLPEEGRIHLSTLMTPEHRKSVILNIRKRLKEGKSCRVVSTSLIEAGVDLDFPVVFRSMAGLDSIIQAGGRCNREGKQDGAIVYVYQPDSKYVLPSVFKRPGEVTKMIMGNTDDIASPEAITEYFDRLYYYEGSLDYYSIISGLNEGIRRERGALNFETISREFHLIDDQNVRLILIPKDDESKQIAENIRNAKHLINRHIYRKMGKYCVSVYDHQYKDLVPALSVIDESLAILEVEEMYNDETGLKFSFEGGDGIFV